MGRSRSGYSNVEGALTPILLGIVLRVNKFVGNLSLWEIGLAMRSAKHVTVLYIKKICELVIKLKFMLGSF